MSIFSFFKRKESAADKEAKPDGDSNKNKDSLSSDDNGEGVDIEQLRKDYIEKNAIQVNAPIPEGVAMDSCASSFSAAPNFSYINSKILSYFIASSSFIGYHAMALIAQHWLVMKGCSIKANDALKSGYKLTLNDGSVIEPERLERIKKLDKKYGLTKHLETSVTFKNVFGIRHILFKHKDHNFDYEKPFNPDSFKNGSYEGIKQIDPMWVTPAIENQDLTDPTQIEFYEPTFWMISGKKYHKSHFVILKTESVADYLKPTYRYGGVSLTQRLYERVYAGERTANEVPQLAMTKRTMIRKTDLERMQANKKKFVENLSAANEMMNNFGTHVAGLDEEIQQIETSLTDLDKAMWTQYDLVASICDVPVSKLYGTGFNGFSTGETDEDYYISSLEKVQSTDFELVLDAHYARLLASEIGEQIDLDVVWNPLKVMSSVEIADINNKNANTATLLASIGAIDGVDERSRIIADEKSGYSGIEKLEIDEGE